MLGTVACYKHVLNSLMTPQPQSMLTPGTCMSIIHETLALLVDPGKPLRALVCRPAF